MAQVLKEFRNVCSHSRGYLYSVPRTWLDDELEMLNSEPVLSLSVGNLGTY